MNSSAEDSLWNLAGVRTVSELPDFPFPSHEAFVASIRNGDASIGIEYGAARDLTHITKSPVASIALLSLSWVPPLFMLASIVVAIVTGSWAILVGIPTAIIGMFFASPYHRRQGIAFLFSQVSLAYCLISATVLTAGTWSAFAFGLSFLSHRFLNRTAWSWAHKATLDSEALTAYLWKTANLHVKGKEFGMKSTGHERY